jgi:hypothetical protein
MPAFSAFLMRLVMLGLALPIVTTSSTFGSNMARNICGPILKAAERPYFFQLGR